MFNVTVGSGIASDPFKAGVEATMIATQSSEKQWQLAIVFASSLFDQTQVLRGIQSVIGDSVPLVGASTAGEITHNGPLKKESVVVMLIESDTVRIAIGLADAVDTEGEQAGIEVYKQITNSLNTQPKLVCMFADGLRANPAAIIRGLQSAHGDALPIVGGSAGDNGNFKTTYQYFNGEVHTNAVVAIGFAGAISFSVGLRHGWVPIGSPKLITDSEGNRIKTIDGKPAILLYEEYLGKEEAAKLGEVTLGEIALSYPLGIKDEISGEMMLRAPFFVHEDGSITCGGEMQAGRHVQLMIGSREEALEAARISAENALKDFVGTPHAVLLFSCHVRNTLYSSFEKSAAEVEAVVSVIGNDVPLAGFFTYAEQAPISGETKNIKACKPDTHNETLVTVLLGESIIN